MAIKHVTTQEEFDKEVKGAKAAIVDFWASWCGPCKMFGPIFEKVSDQYKDVNFVKINVEEAPDLANGIMNIPTCHLYKDGEKVADKAGSMNEGQLKIFLDDNLEKKDE